MSNTSQYYLSLEKFEAIQKDIVAGQAFEKLAGGKPLQGFVFTPGKDENGEPKLFVFPLFAEEGKVKEEAVLVQNTNVAYAGCPYPPPCN